MIYAVPFENGKIFQHFGRTPQWKCYTVEDKTILATEIRSSDGMGHGALVELLQNWHIDAVICGGVGPGAQEKLAQAGIKLYAGACGDADTAVQQFLNGTLQYTSNKTCEHHHENHAAHKNETCANCHNTENSKHHHC